MNVVTIILLALVILIIALALYDFFLAKNSIKRNFPVLGRLRFVFIKLGPPIRQYLIASNRDELPFNRSQRNWI